MKALALVIAAAGLLSQSVYADTDTGTRGPLSYSCSSDASSILGSDGTRRSCWPYQCQSAGFGGVYGAACYTYCNSSDMCGWGTVCDTSSSTCVSR